MSWDPQMRKTRSELLQHFIRKPAGVVARALYDYTPIDGVEGQLALVANQLVLVYDKGKHEKDWWHGA